MSLCYTWSMGKISSKLLHEGNMGHLKLKLTSNETPMHVRKATLHTLCACVEESIVFCSLANVYYLLG
jgi:hypothetical protein